MVNGQKFYSSGALLSHLVPVSATDERERTLIAFVERDNRGLRIIDDWSSFGQRTTASGTVLLEDAFVPAAMSFQPISPTMSQPPTDRSPRLFMPASISASPKPRLMKPFTLSAAIPGRGSIAVRSTAMRTCTLLLKSETSKCACTRPRPSWSVPGRAVDAAIASPNEDSVAAASVAVAEAKVLTTEIAVQATNKLFELAGTRSTLEEYNLDRHWRNARAHTLHDPVR